MVTLTLDNELYRRASEAAAAQGKTIDEFVGEAVGHALSAGGVRRIARSGLPVMVVDQRIPKMNPAKVRQSLEEDGF